MPSDDLTELELNFAEAFLATGSAYKAAQLAGYADSSDGWSVVRRPRVRRYLDRRLVEMQGMVDDEGNPICALTPAEIQGVWRRLSRHPDPNVQLRAVEAAAKSQGMFISRSEHTVRSEQTVDVSQLDSILEMLPDSALDALINDVRSRRRTIDVELVEDD